MTEVFSSLPKTNAKELMKTAISQFKSFVFPSLVAIYGPSNRQAENPDQIGTGFLIAQGSAKILVTAKHTLHGKSFAENPDEKAVLVNGTLVHFGESSAKIVELEKCDLSAYCMDEFPLNKCLDSSTLSLEDHGPSVITFGGFLARDFKRHGDMLRPAPLVYSNVSCDVGAGLVGLRYPKRRNLDTKTDKPVVSSKPSGLSGGPMVDTVELIKGNVKIVGVFTDYTDGKAWGESAGNLRNLLALF